MILEITIGKEVMVFFEKIANETSISKFLVYLEVEKMFENICSSWFLFSHSMRQGHLLGDFRNLDLEYSTSR